MVLKINLMMFSHDDAFDIVDDNHTIKIMTMSLLIIM